MPGMLHKSERTRFYHVWLDAIYMAPTGLQMKRKRRDEDLDQKRIQLQHAYRLRKDTMVLVQTGVMMNAFGSDALRLHNDIGLALTGGRHEVGFNVVNADTWVQKIVRRGYYVASIVQTQNSSMVQRGELVHRTLLRIDSPGTFDDGEQKFMFFVFQHTVAIVRFPYNERVVVTFQNDDEYKALQRKYDPVEVIDASWSDAPSIDALQRRYFTYMKRDIAFVDIDEFQYETIHMDDRTVENLRLAAFPKAFPFATQLGADAFFVRLRRPFAHRDDIERALDAVQRHLDTYATTCVLHDQMQALDKHVPTYLQRFRRVCTQDKAYSDYIFMDAKVVHKYFTMVSKAIGFFRAACSILDEPTFIDALEMEPFTTPPDIHELLETHVPDGTRWAMTKREIFYFESNHLIDTLTYHPTVHSTKTLFRYTTPMLERIQYLYEEHKIHHIQQMSQVIHARIRVLLDAPQTRRVLRAIGTLDMHVTFAMVARTYRLSRPTLSSDRRVCIEGMRYPPGLLPDTAQWIENDVDINGLVVLTGGNGSGKSTYMRGVAYACILAHCGCFIGARSGPRIPLLDRVYLRFGKYDDVQAGESAFYNEAKHMKQILDGATQSSLCIIDEWGSSTSARDGEALAYAACTLLQQRGCITLFATHFFRLPPHFPQCLHMEEPVQADDAYSYQVVPGYVQTSRAQIIAHNMFSSVIVG